MLLGGTSPTRMCFCFSIAQFRTIDVLVGYLEGMRKLNQRAFQKLRQMLLGGTFPTSMRFRFAIAQFDTIDVFVGYLGKMRKCNQ